jgi:acetyl esterase
MSTLGPEARAFLQMVEESPVPPTYTLTPANARRQYERLAEMRSTEPVAKTQDFEIDGPDGPIPMRLYEPDAEGPLPVLVYYHGGGWVIGSRDTHDGICTRLCNRADCLVLSVDYRLAPEHPFPAAVEDSYAALEWAARHAPDIGGDPERLAVGGDSAGGNLSAAVTLLARDQDGPEVAHQLLIYPAVATPAVHDFPSYEENGEGYFLEAESMAWFYDHYVGSRVNARNEYLAPLLVDDLSGLPPATVVTAGFDPLRDEGKEYAERLADAEVPAELLHYEGLIHGFANMTDFISGAADAVDEMSERLAQALH